MPVYLVHGFRWPREGFSGINVHIIVNNLEYASTDYLQNEHSKAELLGSFRQNFPEQMKELGTLDFIEQYDPQIVDGTAAKSQPYVFVADKVVTIAGTSQENVKDKSTPAPLSMNVEEVIATGPGLSPKAWEALAEIRDKLAEGEKIGWFVVYNGDPERAYDSEDEYEESSTPTQEVAAPVQSQQTAATMPIREKPEEVLPKPKEEKIPEPPKLKEQAKTGGFRKKFFGKKT